VTFSLYPRRIHSKYILSSSSTQVDKDPNSEGFATFGGNSLSNINLFDAVDDGLSSHIKDIQDLAKEDQVNTDNCYAVLEKFRSACNPEVDFCDGPNHQTFQLSTEQVCGAVDSRTKLDVTATANLFDFQNYAVPQPFTGTSEVKHLRNESAVVCCKDDIGDDDDDDKWYQNKEYCPFTSNSSEGMFLPYPSAKEFCEEDEKGRLCTKDELEKNCGDDWSRGKLVWSSTEAADDILVCPAISSDICSEFVVELDKIYGLNNTYEHNRDNLGPKCGEGYELTEAECREAGKQLKIGQTRDFKVGRWGHTPCECFLWGNQLHYNIGTTCVASHPQYIGSNKGIVCKTNRGNPNPMRVNSLLPIQLDFTNIHFPVDFDRVLSSSGRQLIEGYEYYKHRKVFVTSQTYNGDLREDKSMNGYEYKTDFKGPKCPDGLGLTAAECEEARIELNLQASKVHDRTRAWTPCGCFMWERKGDDVGPLRWDGGSNCLKDDSKKDQVLGMICKKPVDKSGILGADAKCQALANDAGLTGDYKAWISDRGNSPKLNFANFKNDDIPISFQLVDGTIIAHNWDDLLDDSLQHPINMDENGVTVDSPYLVWSSTRTDGTHYVSSSGRKNCEIIDPERPTYTQRTGWASILGSGNTGNAQEAGPPWTARDPASLCSTERRLYCFQQNPVSMGIMYIISNISNHCIDNAPPKGTRCIR